MDGKNCPASTPSALASWGTRLRWGNFVPRSQSLTVCRETSISSESFIVPTPLFLGKPSRRAKPVLISFQIGLTIVSVDPLDAKPLVIRHG